MTGLNTGDCLSVCAACGHRVRVPVTAGMPPTLRHEEGCPRGEWPVLDAITDSEGAGTTIQNYQLDSDGSWSPAVALQPKGWKCRIEIWLTGHRRLPCLARLLARWDERRLG